jgi:hypothetical protein
MGSSLSRTGRCNRKGTIPLTFGRMETHSRDL